MAERLSFKISFNLDMLTLGAGADGLSSPLNQLLTQAPAGTQAALAWLPDLALSDMQTALNLKTGDFGAYVAVADAEGNQLASTFVYLTSGSSGDAGGGQSEAAIGVTLDEAVSLSGTPLFGPLLSGVQLSGLAVSYASQGFGTQDFPLPSGPGGAAQPHPALPPGAGLTVTMDAGGSAQPFTLPAPSDGSAAAVPARAGPSAARAAAPAAVPAAAAADAPAVTWFNVQKSLGPLTVDRIGLVAGDGKFGLAIDAAFDTDAVDVQLTGFTVDFDAATQTASVSLDGLTVAVDAGALQIGGGLVRTTGPAGQEYDGAVLITIGSYGINAVGSYATVNGTPSLFVFGVVEGEFGGPPAFFVTGLAAGFGVNRALRLPGPDAVATFPIVEAATGGGATDTPGALAQLNEGGWVPPQVGEYWVAAGVKFRSFQLIDGFALVTVEFGKELVIALLGAASLLLPTGDDADPEGAPAKPYAYVEITLELVIRPKEGTFSLTALVSPGSFVIDPSCQLTGGLAVDVWFGGNPNAGDFVVCVGGYHPLFTPPSYYPAVPRLGFSWHLSDELQVAGNCYFAVTPACVMGGGLLSVTFDADSLRAWFTAQADLIMYWRPFHFDVDVSISIGVSYTGSIGFISGTFSVELGVYVELWGPPVRGVARVNWWVISFGIDINGGGSSGSNPGTLADWGTFAATSLPKSGNMCQPRAAGGLFGIVTPPSGASVWLFGGDGLALRTETLIPAATVVIDGPTAATTVSKPGLPVSVYPLGDAATVTTSEHRVCVAAWSADGTAWQPGQPMPAGLDVSGWGWTTGTANLPAALWGTHAGQAGPPLATTLVQGVTSVSGTGQATLAGNLPVQAGALAGTGEATLGLPLPATATGSPGPASTGDTRTQVAETIDAGKVPGLRAAVVAAANGCGLGAGLVGGPLPRLAAEIDSVLTIQPMLGTLGTTGPPPAAQASTHARAVTDSAASAGGTVSTSGERGAAEIAGAAAAGAVRAAGGPALRALFLPDRAGARTVAVVGDRWASRADRELLGPGGESECLLGQGATAVWDLTAGERRTLRRTGPGPLWVVALDAGHRPAQAWVEPGTDGAAGGRVAADSPAVMPWLPGGASRVAVTAVAGAAGAGGTGAVGWHGGGELRQIASHVLLGAGVVVRPQSPHAIVRRRSPRLPRTYRELGVTTGRRLAEENWTQHADGARRGWIETWLPPWCRWLVVALMPASGDDEGTALAGPRLTVRWLTAGEWTQPPGPAPSDRARGPRDQSLWLVPVAAGDGTSSASQLSASQPPAVRQAASQLVVRAWAPDGWRLDGVAGFAVRPAAWGAWPPTGLVTPAAQGGPGRPGAADGANRAWWQ